MVADYTLLSDKVVQMNEQIDRICAHMKSLFIHHSADEYPVQLNILANFLFRKYYFLRSEIIKLGAHMKSDAKYLVPLSSLHGKYGSLRVYVEYLSKIPNIEDHLNEVLSMIQYASDPKPIKSLDMYVIDPVEKKEPLACVLSDTASLYTY